MKQKLILIKLKELNFLIINKLVYYLKNQMI